MSGRIAIIGAGAWGIALAIQASRTGAQVHLWSRKELPDPTTRTLSRLDCVQLPDTIEVSNHFPTDAELTLLAVPLQHMRSVLPHVTGDSPLIICCKGVELNTLKLPLEIVHEFYPDRACAVLSGPNFAHEVAKGYPTASVIAAKGNELAQQIALTLSTPHFRLYANDDPIGVEIGGAAKNIFAIAAGAAIGAGLGENARASLITRGVAELSRLSSGLGGSPTTLFGLAGIGDLLLTCTGQSSRNYTLGLELGKGRPLQDILKERTTVTEGVTTTPALLKRAKDHHITTPIIEAVHQLLTGNTTVEMIAQVLMARPLQNE